MWAKTFILFLVISLSCSSALAENPGAQLLRQCNVQGGLVVHVGCGDGSLSAELANDPSFLVQGLDADPNRVGQARRRIMAAGKYGQVSVRAWDPTLLPYSNGLVNLVVVEEPGVVPETEIDRVLRPGGVACIRSGDEWKIARKPWPEEIDQWTHFLHDSTNNAVAADHRVGPPGCLRWQCGPLWSRSHEFNSSLCAMVSGGGRLFYIVDKGLTGVTTPSVPEQWTLVARDAFNGVKLWDRSIDKWGSSQWRSRALRSIPGEVPRRLVADGDRLFVTLGFRAPVSILDAATGDVLHVYEQTDPAAELRVHDGVLLVCTGQRQILAIDTNTHKTLWKSDKPVRPFTLTAAADRVFFQQGRNVVCRRLDDGAPLWSDSVTSGVGLMIAHKDRLLLLRGKNLTALSVESGKVLWDVEAGVRRREMFVAADRLWHWAGERVVGRSLDDGQVIDRPDTDDVFSPGHHLRCYQSKATEDYLITPFRGVEFVSTTGRSHYQSDWVRGPCTYGILPCNGLLYAPPHPCFCYPGVKLRGFNALAAETRDAESDEQPERERPPLFRGPAYGQVQDAAKTSEDRHDWPTYRHDASRFGASRCAVSDNLAVAWEASLGGRLTPPVAADGRVYVAAKDRHTLYALEADDGKALWQFTANGPIDSPPTVAGKLVLFGSADGHVYCLRAEDGALVWRFRAAPNERQIVVFGQLESPWPVHGSVLLADGLVYCTAGRSSYLNGGIRLFALDPSTGHVRHQARIDTWARTRRDAEGKPFIPAYHMEGTQSDILTCQNDYIYLGQTKWNLQLEQQEVPYVMPEPDKTVKAMDLSNEPYVAADAEPNQDYETHQRQWIDRTQADLLARLKQEHGAYSLGERRMGLHVFSTAGYLDDTWFNRTFWMYAANWPGFYLAHRAPKTGQLLVVGPQRTYAVQSYPSRNLQSPLFTPGERGYLLLADRNENEPVLDSRTQGTTKGWGFTRSEPPQWYRWIPTRIRAMALADDDLFVAGPPDVVDPADPMAAFEGRKGAVLCRLAADVGKTVEKHALEAPPVFDGLIVAAARVIVCSTDGRVVCFAGKSGE